MLTYITGAKGFVGSYIKSCIDSYDLELYLQTDETDILDKDELLKQFRQKLPDVVVHLAAISFVPDSFDNPERTYLVNFIGTLRLLQALKEAGFTGTFLYVGTSDAYGIITEEELPIIENRALSPRNPYAVSKVAAESLCYQWSQTENMNVIMVRPFNHIGPGQSPNFVVSDFARQIAKISLGMSDPILYTGNIDVYRDFTDVRDVIRAYYALLRNGQNGQIYNVCSGIGVSIREIVDKLIKISGVDITVEVDKSRLRPAEQVRAFGSFDKLNKQTGWQPEISLDESLNDIYRYWEDRLKNG